MKTYPYHTPEGIIQLVEKRELDELLERLAEARESHLAASARDVQTIQKQSVMLERLAGTLRDIADRQRKGIAKYGTTVADNPLELKQWLQHAYEETLDKAEEDEA